MTDSEPTPVDFGALFEAQTRRMRTNFEVGEKLTGTITGIDSHSVFVDLDAKSEGILDISEVRDENGETTVEVGDTIEAFCVSAEEGEVRLALRMAGPALDASLQDAYESGIPVEGRVEAERKGGFEVRLAGHAAFCPFSQMDIYRQEPGAYIGQRLSFLIVECRNRGRDLVLSRRRLLEQEHARRLNELKETLRVGDKLSGVVRRVMPFGAFVDLGGVEGLVPARELSWSRSVKPEDVVAEGQHVEVSVIEIDWERQRITLSLRSSQDDPWNEAAENYLVGQRCTGLVTHLMPFGAFVEIAPGIEGLVHVSKMGAGARIRHPEEVVTVGDEVEVSIERIDLEQRRISLSMDDTLGKTGAHAGGAGGVEPGKEVRGKVESVAEFGVFVKLPDGRSGLLHVSQVELKGSSNQRRALYDRFPPGSEVDVVVREVRGDRISLTLRETLEREAAEQDVRDFQDSGAKDFGSLGDVFGKLEL
ncbi:MAG: S1 RNA-binding domain-containing protein [Kiritimatiellaeota bacterium]|nr:S1 RNA-binding domain-containing protein [Kiritimatiellota bacterium]